MTRDTPGAPATDGRTTPPPPPPPPSQPPPPSPPSPSVVARLADFGAAVTVIDKDLLRTYPSHACFAAADAPLVAPMRRVLTAFAASCPEVSYCQGLNFITALLLLHGDEASAFALLTALCTTILPSYHSPEMTGLHHAQTALLSVIQLAAPRLNARLHAAGVPVREQTTSWLLCAYLDVLDLDATLRVWDLLFCDGQAALLRTAAAAFVLHEADLVTKPDEELYNLTSLLQCETAELIAESLAPRLQKAAAEALKPLARAGGKVQPTSPLARPHELQ